MVVHASPRTMHNYWRLCQVCQSCGNARLSCLAWICLRIMVVCRLITARSHVTKLYFDKTEQCFRDDCPKPEVIPHHIAHWFTLRADRLNAVFCPHSAFVRVVWISEQTAIISIYSMNWLVFITETECVYCAVRSVHTVHLCVLCGSQNKQRLFPYTAWTDWFL
jgi:hypothetical protein